jgi:hypothetical protein
MREDYNRPVMRSRETRSMDGRVARILALGLVWGMGVLALVVQRFDWAAPRRAAPPPPATAPAPLPPSLDCLLQAPAASIDIVAGPLGCDEANESRFRLTWADDRETSLTMFEQKVSYPVERDTRRSFVASLAEAVHRPVPAAGACSAFRFVDLTWRCGAAAPLHARFSEAHCDVPGGIVQVGPVGLVSRAMNHVVGDSVPVYPSQAR